VRCYFITWLCQFVRIVLQARVGPPGARPVVCRYNVLQIAGHEAAFGTLLLYLLKIVYNKETLFSG
jgi:hypothetical protein